MNRADSLRLLLDSVVDVLLTGAVCLTLVVLLFIGLSS